MSNLVIDKKFFRNKTKGEVLPEHLDSQFNLLATYINGVLIPYIESVIFAVTGGTVGQPASVFCNINNNDVGYMYINDINIDDNLLSLDKIKKIPVGSVLASDYQGDIFAVTPDDSDQLLFGDYFNSMSFRKITSDDIDNNVLTGKQLGVLAHENFASNSFVDIIWDDSISEAMLSGVSNDKIAPGTIGFRHIGEFDDLPYSPDIAAQILLSDFDDKSITNTKITNGSITAVNFTDPQFIEATNLVQGSIKDNHLKPYDTNTQPPAVINLANLKNSNFGAIVNFLNQGVYVHNIKLPREKIALNSLSLSSFSQEIRNAIDKYKQIKEKALQPPVQVQKTKPDTYKILGYRDITHPYKIPNARSDYILKAVVIAVVPARQHFASGKWHYYYQQVTSNEFTYLRYNTTDMNLVLPAAKVNDNVVQKVSIYELTGQLKKELEQYPRDTAGADYSPEFWSWLA